MALAIFKRMCPSCGGDVTSDRLSMGLPCDRCSGEPYWIEEVERRVAELDSYFAKAIGTNMWSAQRLWAKRLFRGKSFAITAPTGSGKTVFGILASLYFAERGKRVLFVLPTSILVGQVGEKACKFRDILGLAGIEIVCYHSFLSKKEKKEALQKIESGDYDVLIVTSTFLTRQFSSMGAARFDLAFVDDVDGILKSSKAFDALLKCIGLDGELVGKALELVNARTEFARYRRLGQAPEAERAAKRIAELESAIARELAERKIGKVVVSSASLRGKRTKRAKLFRELLGFELGSRSEYLRNVVDVYVRSGDLVKSVVELVERLGPGGIVFAPQDGGLARVEELHKALVERGVKSEAYIRPRKGLLKRFERGETEILVGVASYRSPLARGIDLPYSVRYVIFAGVPKFKFSLDPEEFSPAKMLILLANLRECLRGRRKFECDRHIAHLRRALLLGRAGIADVVEAVKEGRQLEGYKEYVRRVVVSVYGFLKKALSDKEVVERLKTNAAVKVSLEGGRTYFVLADPVAYIQGSGRTSRLYSGGISKGLAVTVVDDERAFRQLKRELEYRLEEFEWLPIERVDLGSLMREIAEERELIKALAGGKKAPSSRDLVKTSLLVVESPSKAKTISRFYGSPARRKVGSLYVYEVNTGDRVLQITATGGHLFDLVTDEGLFGVLEIGERVVPVYSTIKRCLDCGETFTEETGKCPKCGSGNIRDTREVVEALRELAFEVDEVLIGTDPDSEGEKIAWDVALVLKPYSRSVKRVEFHEITKRAIEEALANPREIDERLVRAQIVRRIEDRWVGFGLSQIVQEEFDRRSLSAGRVQTPVLGWIIDHYRKKKESKVYLARVMLNNGLRLYFRLDVRNGWEARRLVKKLVGESVSAEVLEERVEDLSPPPPLTTDAMLREASTRLGLSAGRTMRLAQDLFELGLITYHRTDSTRVSRVGMALARKYLEEKLGAAYYKGRSWQIGGEGAHECIRPTRPIDAEELRKLVSAGILRLSRRLERDHFRVYDLVFRRFVASQMVPAKIERKRIRFRVAGEYSCELDIRTGILERGFTLVLPLPVFENLSLDSLEVKESDYLRTSDVKILTQGDAVALMKERGLGRPSTYAKILETLSKRGYVMNIGKRAYLIPLDRGIKVFEFLSRKYPELVSEERTRRLLAKMDRVERGLEDYQRVLRELKTELSELGVLGRAQRAP